MEEGPATEIFSPAELKKLGVSKSLETDFRGLFKFPFAPSANAKTAKEVVAESASCRGESVMGKVDNLIKQYEQSIKNLDAGEVREMLEEKLVNAKKHPCWWICPLCPMGLATEQSGYALKIYRRARQAGAPTRMPPRSCGGMG